MNEFLRTHHWLRGGLRRDRELTLRELGVGDDGVLRVDAHRRLRGPYSAAGRVVTALVPRVLPRDPGLVHRYDIELLSAAPELSAIVPSSRETLTSMAIPAERTRYYARLRTVRIGNGLVEFIRDSPAEAGPRVLVVENVDQADPTDLEFLASLLRRVDPERLLVQRLDLGRAAVVQQRPCPGVEPVVGGELGGIVADAVRGDIAPGVVGVGIGLLRRGGRGGRVGGDDRQAGAGAEDGAQGLVVRVGVRGADDDAESLRVHPP